MKEEEFVEFGREDFKQFFKYVCSMKHVKVLAENHFTKLKLKYVYSDEILANLKNTLKDYPVDTQAYSHSFQMAYIYHYDR